MVRPVEDSTGAGRASVWALRRPGQRVAAALVVAGLIAAGALLGLALSDGPQSAEPGPGMRLASPEEAAAAAGSLLSDAGDPDIGQSEAPDPAAERLLADGSQAEESLSAEQGTPGLADASPEPLPPPASPQYPAPAVAEEPVVAVAAAVSPSVVLVQVGSEAGSGVRFGLGSGIVWDAENGYIVTNHHVVDGASRVKIVLPDGINMEGEVIGGSSAHDVAVVRVDPEAAELVAARFAPASSVRVGQLAVAIGSPLGLTGTVTAGIVSAVRIQVQGGSDLDSPVPVPVEMIQTDAAINQGNSGGALADWQGRVIGMNTLIQTTSGGSIGLGFAVPSDTVELIANRIVNGESLELGYLGISGQAAEGGDLGVVVIEVVTGSPAEEAGLRVGDVIVSIDAEPMYDIRELSAAVKLRRPGETVELTVARGGDIYIATAVLDALG